MLAVHITGLSADGFRSLSGRIPLVDPLSIIIGENNAGKSAVIDALRILLEPEAGPRFRQRITEEDFTHDGRGQRLADTLTLEVEFANLTDAEQAQMVTCLAPSLGPRSARLRIRATINENSKINLDWLGGDSEHPDVERWARQATTYTYLHPLRDAAADLRPGRENQLAHLIASLAPSQHPDRALIESIVKAANVQLSAVGAVAEAKNNIQGRLKKMTGPGPFLQHTDLVFSDPKFARTVATLRALMGDHAPLELAESGLGYSNLLYMAVLLAGLKDAPDSLHRVLLVEEPEAHLHPQFQDLLLKYLETESGSGVQAITTTHSPNFAASARVERMTIMIRNREINRSSGLCPGDFGMTNKQLDHLRRFLDVTKSSLLFARGVVLVEGIAEQLLVPVIARRLGVSFESVGVTVANISGVAFDPFLALFGETRIPYTCVVISDGDPADASEGMSEEESAEDPATADETGAHEELEEPDSDEEQADAEEVDEEEAREEAAEEAVAGLAPSARAKALRARSTGKISVHLARKTLEWDLIAEGNWAVCLEALRKVKPRVASKLEKQNTPELTDAERADMMYKKLVDIKGQFAQELADLLENPSTAFKIPDYLTKAITKAISS